MVHHSRGLSTGVGVIAIWAACQTSAAWAQNVTPTVDYPGTLGVPAILQQERGLNLPVPPVVNVAAVNVQEAIDQATQLNQRWSTRCVGTAPWVANGARVILSDAAATNPFFFCRFGVAHDAT